MDTPIATKNVKLTSREAYVEILMVSNRGSGRPGINNVQMGMVRHSFHILTLLAVALESTGFLVGKKYGRVQRVGYPMLMSVSHRYNASDLSAPHLKPGASFWFTTTATVVVLTTKSPSP